MKDWNVKSDPVFDKFNNTTTGKLSTIEARYATTDFLRFDLERIHQLAKPFTNAQQMIDYKGDNEKLINAAGRYIQYNWEGRYPRPKWFEDFNVQTKEEVFEEVSQLTGYFADLDWNVQQKCWRHWDKKELKNVFPNLIWKRKPKTDDEALEIMSHFKTAGQMRKHSKQYKNLLSRIASKPTEYPKSYARYQEMMVGHTTRSKRGKYKQRTPAIEQYDLDGNYIKTYATWDDALADGFKRNSVAAAIRGTDGNNKHKGFLWKHEGKQFTK